LSASLEKGRQFPCLACGADAVFDIATQHLRCDFCGSIRELSVDGELSPEEQDYHETLSRLAELRNDEEEVTAFKEVACDDCGARIRFQGTLTSSECAYCGAPHQIDNVHEAESRVPTDGVLPFKVTRDAAREAFRKWVRSRWFAPNDFKKRSDQGQFNGVYTPYWTYDSMTMNQYEGMRGDHYYVSVGSGKNRRRVRHTRWSPASGTFSRFFDDVLAVAARGLPDGWLKKLEPWPLQSCRPYRPEFLSGFQARTYDIPLDEGFVDAKAQIDAALRSDVRGRIGGDVQQVHSIDTRYEAMTFTHLLLPVWMMVLRYRNKPFQIVINAATGEVQGARPVSWVKITLAILAVAVTIGAIVVLKR